MSIIAYSLGNFSKWSRSLFANYNHLFWQRYSDIQILDFACASDQMADFMSIIDVDNVGLHVLMKKQEWDKKREKKKKKKKIREEEI